MSQLPLSVILSGAEDPSVRREPVHSLGSFAPLRMTLRENNRDLKIQILGLGSQISSLLRQIAFAFPTAFV